MGCDSVSDLVSIIMPSYNTDKFIAKSINSVLNQTYKNWELIIVDDCSTDKTDEVVDSFLQDSRIHYFKNDKNSGAAVTRNRAIREAKGKYIAFLDSDDLWDPNKLEKQIAFMQKNNIQFSYCCYEKIDEQDNKMNVTVTGPKRITEFGMYNFCYPGCLTVIYDAEYVGLVQIADIKKNNDYAIWLKVIKKCDCYLYDEILAQYRIRKRSISHDKITKKLKSHYDLFHFCDEQPAPIAFWYACWNMWYGFLKKMNYEKKCI